MKIDLHYIDPRFVALYDTDNPRGIDSDFWLQLARDIKAKTILDLGCGTGLLTRELATSGRKVIGVDPSPAMLAYARKQPGAEYVEWREGDAQVLGAPEADLALMTGNVAQIFLDDSDWLATLRHIHAALRPGGYLAFESRNPEARAWQNWTQEATYERTNTPYGPLECWLEFNSEVDGRVRFEGHNIFADTGEIVTIESELRFRTRAELTDSLQHAGFGVEHVYGGWHHEPVRNSSQMLVIIARRA